MADDAMFVTQEMIDPEHIMEEDRRRRDSAERGPGFDWSRSEWISTEAPSPFRNADQIYPATATQADRATSSSPAEAPEPAPEPPPTSWVEVQVQDQDGQPLRNVNCRIEDVDGVVTERRTNGQGLLMLRGIGVGPVQVSLPDLDASTWSLA